MKVGEAPSSPRGRCPCSSSIAAGTSRYLEKRRRAAGDGAADRQPDQRDRISPHRAAGPRAPRRSSETARPFSTCSPRCARSLADTAVLILGETGTGKDSSPGPSTRAAAAGKPLVKVNCAAIPATLIESEFFGHERGAFTGATARRDGRFALADGGTIFLDEVGELPLELQGKLLRVLQEGEFELVGSSRTRKVDVRVVAATNRDLRAPYPRKVPEDLFTSSASSRCRCLHRERGDVVLLLASLRPSVRRSRRRRLAPISAAAAAGSAVRLAGNVRAPERHRARGHHCSGGQLRAPSREQHERSGHPLGPPPGTHRGGRPAEREPSGALEATHWRSPGGAGRRSSSARAIHPRPRVKALRLRPHR